MTTLSEAFGIAVGFHQAGRLSEAEQAYRQILATAPEHMASLNNLGIIVSPEEAITLFRRALAVNPYYADAHQNLGRALQGQGKHEEARAHFQEAFRVQPNSLTACTNLGAAFETVGQYDQALVYFQKALEIAPDDANSHHNIGRILEAQNKIDEALSYFEQAVRIQPDFAAALYSIGNIQKSRGNDNVATAYFLKVKKIMPFYVEPPNDPHSKLKDAPPREGGAILITGPDAIIYRDLMRDFSAGFAEIGIACYTSVFQNKREGLHDWVIKNNIKVVIEINNVIDSTEGWPSSVIHVLWVLDYRQNYGKSVLTELGKSDAVYFIETPRIFSISPPTDRKWGILLFGTPYVDLSDNVDTMARDFAMAGYIPPPLKDDMPVAHKADGTPVSLQEFLAVYPPRYTSFALNTPHDFNVGMAETCAKIGCELLPEAVEIFDTIIPRTYERSFVLKSLIGVSSSLDIYGPHTWKHWSAFAKFYRGFLPDVRDLYTVFKTSRVNIHVGCIGMHNRVLECMAAGGFIMVNETPRDFDAGGIRQYFEPDRHYGSYTMDNVAEVARHYLENHEARRRIIIDAKRQILAGHLWRHRALQVARDFDL